MVIDNEPGKKDKKTLDFLKAEMIINKMIGHSVCLVKRSKIFTGHVLHVRLSADGILGAVKQSC